MSSAWTRIMALTLKLGALCCVWEVSLYRHIGDVRVYRQGFQGIFLFECPAELSDLIIAVGADYCDTSLPAFV